jgi:hypothetical protein
MACPPWLDKDFLYTLNYGPSESDPSFKERLESVLDLVHGEPEQRERITLLDRSVAERLHKAIFGERYKGARFLTDWSEGPKWLILVGDKNSVTPFDYDPHASETQLFLRVEAFITTETLDPYFLRSALCDPRPSIVPIALDVVDLICYLASLPTQQPPSHKSKTIDQYLSDFIQDRELRSVVKPISNLVRTYQVQPEAVGRDKVVLRYLADMLKSATLLPDDSHWEVLGRRFPGPDLLLGASPSTPSSSLTQIFLDDFTADFICSGPFRLIAADDIRHHLRLTEKNEIQLFLNSAEFLSMYNCHSLKRCMIECHELTLGTCASTILPEK